MIRALIILLIFCALQLSAQNVPGFNLRTAFCDPGISINIVNYNQSLGCFVGYYYIPGQFTGNNFAWVHMDTNYNIIYTKAARSPYDAYTLARHLNDSIYIVAGHCGFDDTTALFFADSQSYGSAWQSTLLRLDAYGNVLQKQRIGKGTYVITDMKLAPETGNIYIIGTTDDTTADCSTSTATMPGLSKIVLKKYNRLLQHKFTYQAFDTLEWLARPEILSILTHERLYFAYGYHHDSTITNYTFERPFDKDTITGQYKQVWGMILLDSNGQYINYKAVPTLNNYSSGASPWLAKDFNGDILVYMQIWPTGPTNQQTEYSDGRYLVGRMGYSLFDDSLNFITTRSFGNNDTINGSMYYDGHLFDVVSDSVLFVVGEINGSHSDSNAPFYHAPQTELPSSDDLYMLKYNWYSDKILQFQRFRFYDDISHVRNSTRDYAFNYQIGNYTKHVFNFSISKSLAYIDSPHVTCANMCNHFTQFLMEELPWPVAIEPEQQTTNAKLVLYPVPAEHTLQVQVNKACSEAYIQVIDALGAVVLQQAAHALSNTTAVDVRQLSSGQYYLRYVCRNGVLTAKFSVE
ncbi:MAG: Secretion system C-terminal sorting domain [Bacteroidota bacterium]|jgi:hypothetical protein